MVLYDTDAIARVRQTTHTVRKLSNRTVRRLYIVKRNWRLEADRKALSMFTSLGFLGAFLAGFGSCITVRLSMQDATFKCLVFEDAENV